MGILNVLSNKTKSGSSAFDNPTTTKDMLALEKWSHGDDVDGVFARSVGAFARYRDDINKGYGRENDYLNNVKYVNTFKPLGDQLQKLK